MRALLSPASIDIAQEFHHLTIYQIPWTSESHCSGARCFALLVGHMDIGRPKRTASCRRDTNYIWEQDELIWGAPKRPVSLVNFGSLTKKWS